MNTSIKILISCLLFISCGSSEVYENPISVVKVEKDTVYISQTDWEKVKALTRENHLLRVEIDQLKKKVALMKIRYQIEKTI